METAQTHECHHNAHFLIVVVGQNLVEALFGCLQAADVTHIAHGDGDDHVDEIPRQVLSTRGQLM